MASQYTSSPIISVVVAAAVVMMNNYTMNGVVKNKYCLFSQSDFIYLQWLLY